MDSDTGAVDRLAAEWVGDRDADGRPVVLLHGFAQDRRCWGPIAAGLASRRAVLVVDLPGHGGSSARSADLDGTVRLLESTLAGEDVPADGTVDVLGYSMGGRVALVWACVRPGRIARLVTIGATAGIEDPTARAERHRLDEERARELEADGVDVFVDRWLAQPMFAQLPGWARFTDERRANTAAGLAASLRLVGTGAMRPRWDDLAGLGRSGGAPALLALAGRRDPDYVAHAERLAGAVAGRCRVVDDAGHAVHLEQPEEAQRLVTGFLDEA